MNAPNPPPLPQTPPTSSINCWKCGYDLRGLQVTDKCPECGTPVWSPGRGTNPQVEPDALVWGIVSLALFFLCIGPLAAVVAIPAIIKGSRASDMVRSGTIPTSHASNARTGMILGWITVGLSIAGVVIYGLFFLLAAVL